MGMMQRNTAAKIRVFAYNTSTGAPTTGDAANITAKYELDSSGTRNALADTNPIEINATDAPGWYEFDVTAGETNGVDYVDYVAISATANILVLVDGGRQVLYPAGLLDDGTISTFDFADTLPGSPTADTIGDALKRASVGIPQSAPGLSGGLATFANVLGAAVSGTINDGTPAAGEFDGDSGLEASDNNRYVGQFLVFTGGTLQGEAQQITGYTAATRTLTFSTPFTATPANSDPFLILGRVI